MKLTVTDKKTNEVLYSCITEGDPENPTAIHESGSKLMEFKKKCKEWEVSNETRFGLSCEGEYGPGAYTIEGDIVNVVDDDTMNLTVEDLPPRKLDHEPTRHGAAFDFAYF